MDLKILVILIRLVVLAIGCTNHDVPYANESGNALNDGVQEVMKPMMKTKNSRKNARHPYLPVISLIPRG